MKIKVIEQTLDTIVANINDPIQSGEDNIIIVAEYWIDENMFVFVNEYFTKQGLYLCCDNDEYLTDEEKEEVKNYLKSLTKN